MLIAKHRHRNSPTGHTTNRFRNEWMSVNIVMFAYRIGLDLYLLLQTPKLTEQTESNFISATTSLRQNRSNLKPADALRSHWLLLSFLHKGDLQTLRDELDRQFCASTIIRKLEKIENCMEPEFAYRDVAGSHPGFLWKSDPNSREVNRYIVYTVIRGLLIL